MKAASSVLLQRSRVSLECGLHLCTYHSFFPSCFCLPLLAEADSVLRTDLRMEDLGLIIFFPFHSYAKFYFKTRKESVYFRLHPLPRQHCAEFKHVDVEKTSIISYLSVLGQVTKLFKS